jgi:hypothetical protein
METNTVSLLFGCGSAKLKVVSSYLMIDCGIPFPGGRQLAAAHSWPSLEVALHD